MINWPIYSNTQAEEDFEVLQRDFSNLYNITVPLEFQPLRNQLLEARDRVYDKYNFDETGIEKQKYTFDLEFGLEMFLILNNYFDFNNRDASNDNVWRYLSIQIVPDIVHSRYNFSADRYYKMTRRIYLKQIYWYINVGWQGDVSSTYEVLKNNTTDTIVSFVERPSNGYNLPLLREIMRQYSQIQDSSRNILRRAFVLNTAQIKNVSPEFIEGGIEQYVNLLFKRVM